LHIYLSLAVVRLFVPEYEYINIGCTIIVAFVRLFVTDCMYTYVHLVYYDRSTGMLICHRDGYDGYNNSVTQHTT